jgi:TonB family protein
LNSTLDMGSGISGECLRSGKALCCHDTSADSRVDAAACRRLALRSLAAAPIGEKPSVQGILEAFSARPYAFGDTEVSLLKELAELVIAAQQGSTKPAAPLTRMHETLARKALSVSKSTLVAAAFVTLAFVVWLGLRKRPDHFNLAAAAGAHPLKSESSPAAVDFSLRELKPEGSPVSDGSNKTKPSAGVVMASKIAKFSGDERVVARPSPDASDADQPLLHVPGPRSQPPRSRDESAPIPPPVAEVASSSDKAIAGLLSSSAVLPQPVMISQGLSGGTLEYKVNPIYPREARMLRRQGRVTLDAVIAEDGKVRDLKVVDGDMMLAGAAMQAVSKWRYRPYKLNGEPIRMSTTITLIFKLP